jgi:hypothetical protein
MSAASIKALTSQLVDSQSALAKALESSNSEQINDILTTLQAVPTPSLELMKSTSIVQALKSVSKKYVDSKDDSELTLQTKAQTIISKWKEDSKKSIGLKDEPKAGEKADGGRKSTRPTKEVKYNEEIHHETAELKDVKKKIATSGKMKVSKNTQPIPLKNANGELVFPDYPEFRPNMTPREVIQAGSFGGTYYRAIYSSVTQTQYDDKQWEEFPAEWFEGLNVTKLVRTPT